MNKMRDLAEKEWKYRSKDELHEMVNSREANTRLVAFFLMRKQIKAGDSPNDYYDLARSGVEDSDNNCRWQSLIVIAECIESEPERVWEVVAKFGDSPDADMRTAIAVLLLEHLLDYDFANYFAKVREEILRGRHRFINTLEGCWFDRNSGTNYRKVKSFLRKAKRGLSPEE